MYFCKSIKKLQFFVISKSLDSRLINDSVFIEKQTKKIDEQINYEHYDLGFESVKEMITFHLNFSKTSTLITLNICNLIYILIIKYKFEYFQ